MAFDPRDVWSWYQRRPTWQKWFLFAFIILLVVVTAVVAYFMRGRFIGSGAGNGPDPLQTGKDATEEHFWGRYNEAKKRDDKAATAIDEERDGRAEREKERVDAADTNREGHEAIDAADDFDDVDAAVRNARRN